MASQDRAIFPKNGHLKALGVNKNQLAEWWQDRSQHWFLDTERLNRIKQYYTGHIPLTLPIIESADHVLNDEFPLLGHGPTKIDGPNRWHRDPIFGTLSPKTFYGRIQYLDPNEVGDSKRVWEPSRFGWAYPLGMAYNLTRDQRYAEKFSQLTLDWFADNPYPQGIHYCSALELGFRAYAWTWALDLFHDYLSQNSELLEKILHGIWISCRHIEHNLSNYFAPNTHLLGEAFALYVVGAAIPEFAASKRWRELGNRILSEEGTKQFHADGTHRELSSCYHLYSTDFYLQATLISRQTGNSIDPIIETTAKTSAKRLAQLVPGDLQLPQFNDCDGGRLTWFCQAPLDAAPTLLAASQLWDDVAIPEEFESRNGYHLWMGQNNKTTDIVRSIPMMRNTNLAIDKESAKIPAAPGTTNGRHLADASTSGRQRSRLPDSGIAAYRNAADDYLLFRSGPFGYMDCGHSHDAATSFILHFAGQPIIVDSGTGSYTQSHEIRDRFRNAAGKNCLLIDGNGPSVPGDWFNWEYESDAKLTVAEQFPGGFVCRGQHDAFSHALGFRVEISRRLVLYHRGILVIVDQWRAEQPIDCKLALTLDPSLTAVANENGVAICDDNGNEYHLAVQHLSSPVEVIDGSSNLSDPHSDQRTADPSESHSSVEDWRIRHSGKTTVGSSIGPKLTRIPFSPGYGQIEETVGLECDFGTSTEGCALTIVSRVGEISFTTSAVTDQSVETRFTVSDHKPHRTNVAIGRLGTPTDPANLDGDFTLARPPKEGS